MILAKQGIAAIGLSIFGAHDALALAGLSEPMGFGDGVLLCGAMSWFVALPAAALLSVLIAALWSKRRHRKGLKPRSGAVFGVSFVACLTLYVLAVLAFVGIGMRVCGG